MGTILRLRKKIVTSPAASASAGKIEQLQVLLKAHVSQIAAMLRTCEALNQSTDVLRKNLNKLSCLIEGIEDSQTREELKARLHTADLKLSTSLGTLSQAKLFIEKAGEHANRVIEF